jgi:protein-L-isoaspartate O-methyltransferase
VAESGYVLSNEWSDERRRLAALEELFDPATFRVLVAVGIQPGWTCLEVGGGGGSVARWLASQVGPAGSVLATDLDTRFLDEIDLPNVEVRKHDIQRDQLDRTFDLIHARCLLEHLPERDAVLPKLVSALDPGGWIVVEVGDCTLHRHLPTTRQFVSPQRLGVPMRRFFRAVDAVGADAGGDWEFGRTLPARLVRAGLVEVDAEMSARLIRGGTARAEFFAGGARQLATAVIATGLVSEDDLDVLLAAYADPDTMFMSTPVVAAWGRRRV